MAETVQHNERVALLNTYMDDMKVAHDREKNAEAEKLVAVQVQDPLKEIPSGTSDLHSPC